MPARGEEPADFEHDPVMRDEIVGTFGSVPAGVVLDATLGGGGHGEAILDARRRPARARPRPRSGGARRRHRPARPVRRSCDDPSLPLRRPRRRDGGRTRSTALSGALFDLGVSSPQLDRAERGFSYRNDGPLDMRMDTDAAWSADDVVNGYDEAELTRVIRQHGDERFATPDRPGDRRRPADRDDDRAGGDRHRRRSRPPAGARADIPPSGRSRRSASRSTASSRCCPAALDKAIEALVPGGRIAVLSYHSGEDRIVKERFRCAETGGCECPPELPCVCGAVQTVRLVRGVRQAPDDAGAGEQPPSRVGALRVAERTAEKLEAG